MKRFIIVCGLLVSACNLSVSNAKVPAGYQTCSSDLDCAKGSYCGFISVDSVAVCKSGESDSQDLQTPYTPSH